MTYSPTAALRPLRAFARTRYLAGLSLAGSLLFVSAAGAAPTDNIDDFAPYTLEIAEKIRAARATKNEVLAEDIVLGYLQNACAIKGKPVKSTWRLAELREHWGSYYIFLDFPKSSQRVRLTIQAAGSDAQQYLPALSRVKAGDPVPFSGALHPGESCPPRRGSTSIGDEIMMLTDVVLDLSRYGGSSAQRVLSPQDFSDADSDTKLRLCRSNETLERARALAIQRANEKPAQYRFNKKGLAVVPYGLVRKGQDALEMLSRSQIEKAFLKPDSLNLELIASEKDMRSGRCQFRVTLRSGSLKFESSLMATAKADARNGLEEVTVSMSPAANYQLMPD